mgnify:CR=1 FL=1
MLIGALMASPSGIGHMAHAGGTGVEPMQMAEGVPCAMDRTHRACQAGMAHCVSYFSDPFDRAAGLPVFFAHAYFGAGEGVAEEWTPGLPSAPPRL